MGKWGPEDRDSADDLWERPGAESRVMCTESEDERRQNPFKSKGFLRVS